MRHSIAARVFGTLLSVCALLVFRPAIALADPLPPAVLQPLAPASYQRLSAHTDPRGGSPVYITGQDLVVRARVQGVQRVVVYLTGGGTLDFAQASGTPDAMGRVVIPLHLPYAGGIYVIQAYATPGFAGRGMLPIGSFRAMAPGTARMPASDGWVYVRRQLPATIPVYRPTWLPARFDAPVSVEVPDPNVSGVSGGPAYRVGYRSASGNVLIFALGAVNSVPPASSEPLAVAGVTGHYVTILPGWWPQTAVLWQEGAWEGKPLAYTVQAMGVSRDELLQVAASLTVVPSASPGDLPQSGEGGIANGAIPSLPLLLILAGSPLLAGWLGRPGSTARNRRH